MRNLPLLCVVAAASYQLGRESHQDVNDLLSAGFTLTDPEGFECRSFEEGFGSAVRGVYARLVHWFE